MNDKPNLTKLFQFLSAVHFSRKNSSFNHFQEFFSYFFNSSQLFVFYKKTPPSVISKNSYKVFFNNGLIRRKNIEKLLKNVIV